MGGLRSNQGKFNWSWIVSRFWDVLGCAGMQKKVAFGIGYIDSDLILQPPSVDFKPESHIPMMLWW